MKKARQISGVENCQGYALSWLRNGKSLYFENADEKVYGAPALLIAKLMADYADEITTAKDARITALKAENERLRAVAEAARVLIYGEPGGDPYFTLKEALAQLDKEAS